MIRTEKPTRDLGERVRITDTLTLRGLELPPRWRWMAVTDQRGGSSSRDLAVDHLVESERVGPEIRVARACGAPAWRYVTLRGVPTCARCLAIALAGGE